MLVVPWPQTKASKLNHLLKLFDQPGLFAHHWLLCHHSALHYSLENQFMFESMSSAELVLHLNNETGQITWQELQPYFAQGRLLYLAAGLDLIDTAAALVHDDQSIILPLINSQQLGKLPDALASQFIMTDVFWAVVTAPWVVVQKIEAKNSQTAH